MGTSPYCWTGLTSCWDGKRTAARLSRVSNASWAEEAIEGACLSAEQWMRGLPTFDPQPKTSDGAVVAGRYPALLSERDCAVAFARMLHDQGVPWEAIHSELSISRWIFDSSHRAGRKMSESGALRRVDLALVKPEEMLHAAFPASDPGFQFDAFMEFGQLTSYWTVPGAKCYGVKNKAHKKVKADIEEISAQVASVTHAQAITRHAGKRSEQAP
jgi:hypothetical protein